MNKPEIDLSLLLAKSDAVEEALGIEAAQQFRWILHNARVAKPLVWKNISEWLDFGGEMDDAFMSENTCFGKSQKYIVKKDFWIAGWVLDMTGKLPRRCDSLEHGKALAEAHWQELFNSMSKGVVE